MRKRWTTICALTALLLTVVETATPQPRHACCTCGCRNQKPICDLVSPPGQTLDECMDSCRSTCGGEENVTLVAQDCTDPICPRQTAIELVSFTVEVQADRTVTLVWETATEVDNAGFNLYRATTEGGPYTKINSALIPAQGDPVAGASYNYVDTPGPGTFRYILMD